MASDVLAEALRLSAHERAQLVRALIRSLDSERNADVAAPADEEIEQRAAEAVTGAASTMTFDEYREHLRARRAARGQ